MTPAQLGLCSDLTREEPKRRETARTASIAPAKRLRFLRPSGAPEIGMRSPASWEKCAPDRADACGAGSPQAPSQGGGNWPGRKELRRPPAQQAWGKRGGDWNHAAAGPASHAGGQPAKTSSAC